MVTSKDKPQYPGYWGVFFYMFMRPAFLLLILLWVKRPNPGVSGCFWGGKRFRQRLDGVDSSQGPDVADGLQGSDVVGYDTDPVTPALQDTVDLQRRRRPAENYIAEFLIGLFEEGNIHQAKFVFQG